MDSCTKRKMKFNCIILLILVSHLNITLAQTSAEDATALLSLSRIWKSAPLNWLGLDPCGSQWTGITCFGNRVTSVRLSSIGLAGMLSGDIAALTELTILDLSYNKGLMGSLPSAIGNLTKLTDLILVGCSFTGIIPDLGSLQNLRTLSLNSNGFSGSIPASIGKLSNLYWLDLTDNHLSGPLPVSSETSPGLDQLLEAGHFHLGKNQLSGHLPSKLFSSEMKLIHLILDNNNFSGIIPPTLGLVKKLIVMQLSNNKFSGSPPDLTGMNALSFVDMSNNSFDPSDVPPWFSTLPLLTTLWMERSRVQGQLPGGVFSTQLQTLHLKNNLINGTLDMGSSVSDQLQLVDLENNQIERVPNVQVYKKELRLAGNPYCDERPSDSHCATAVKSTQPYATPIPPCQGVDCGAVQKKSPNCRCAYPYTGTLFFPAVLFSDLGDATRFNVLETNLNQSFWNHTIAVDSVALSNTFINQDNYLQTDINVFPSASKSSFNLSEVAALGFILSNQTFKAPRFFGPFFFIGNPYLGTQEANTDSPPSAKSNLRVIIGAAAAGVVLALIVVLPVVYFLKKKSKGGEGRGASQPFAGWDSTGTSGNEPRISAPISFTFSALKKITNNFSDANLIGVGGYGKVYKGILPDGQLVAIKRGQSGSIQGGLEFKTEIELLSMVHHKNLVKLAGFCFDKEEHMLVYEYIPNGSLRDSLSGKSGIVLDWKRRLRVAVGAARGLSYLHDHLNPPVIHRDVKSNNILLDENLNAKVADFGLSKSMGEDQKGHVTTQVKGTMGYLDPEYYTTQRLTDKSDVYSFGVLMLELITARKPIENGRYVVRQVKLIMDETKDLHCLDELLDPNLDLGGRLPGFEKFIQLAMKCVEEEGIARPSMSEVVKEIEHVMQLAGMNPAVDSARSSDNYSGSSQNPYNSYKFEHSGGIPNSHPEPN